MGLFSSLKNAAVSITKGVVKAVEVTCEICEEAFRWGKEKCYEIKGKIDRWQTEGGTPPVDPVPPEIKTSYEPKIKRTKDKIEEIFPAGIKEECTKLTPEERKNKVLEMAEVTSQILEIENPPEIVFGVPENEEDVWRSYGSYNHNQNTLTLNLAMIVTEEPKLFQEQISTVFHEMVHARQLRAIDALRQGVSCDNMGYTNDWIESLAINWINYISPNENYEAYTKQPIEAEAYWVEQQLGLTSLN